MLTKRFFIWSVAMGLLAVALQIATSPVPHSNDALLQLLGSLAAAIPTTALLVIAWHLNRRGILYHGRLMFALPMLIAIALFSVGWWFMAGEAYIHALEAPSRRVAGGLIVQGFASIPLLWIASGVAAMVVSLDQKGRIVDTKKIDIGNVLSNSFSTYGATLKATWPISLAVAVGGELAMSLGTEVSTSTGATAVLLLTFVGLLAYMFVVMLGGLYMTNHAMHRVFAIDSASGAIDIRAAATLAVLVTVALTLSLIFLVVPMIYLSVRWAMILPVFAGEGRRGGDALSRSGELMRGNWWRVFCAFFVVSIPYAAGIPELYGMDSGSIAGHALAAAVSTLILPLWIATTIVIYQRLTHAEDPSSVS